MFTQQKPNPDGGITVQGFKFQKHPQDLPQCLKAERPTVSKRPFSYHKFFFSVLCVFLQWVWKKRWVRSHLNTDALHKAYLLYLASSYLCMIKIVICSCCWGRAAACASRYKQQEKPSRTMTIAFSKVMSLIWLSIPIIATGPQVLMCWINKSANITPSKVS